MKSINRVCLQVLAAWLWCVPVMAGKTDTGPVGKSVLEHYAKSGDTLKLRAAEFLVENMCHHHSYGSGLLDKYYAGVDTIADKYKYPDCITHYQQQIQQLGGDIGAGRRLISDSDGITAEQLIANIDAAFDDWRNGLWAGHLTFSQFCEYLLPYRVGNEKYEDWRSELKDRFMSYADMATLSDERRHSAFFAAYNVCDGIKKINFRINDKALPKTDIDLPVSVLMKMRMGVCNDYARLTTYAMRACGIPVAIDFTPQWPNKSKNHTWNVLLDNTGRIMPFLGCETYPGQANRPGEKMAKIYRQTFAYNPMSAVALCEAFGKPVPPSLSNPFVRDVTNEYFNGANFSMQLPETPFDRRIAYLAVFNNAEWIPVDHSVIDSTRRVSFSSLGREIVYMPVYWGRNGAIPCADPFLIRKDGSIHWFRRDAGKTMSLTLERKYPVFGRVFDFAKTMCGGYFEASDSADFKNAVRVAELMDIPSLWYNTINIDTDGRKYRYWRYRSPNGKGDIAEMEFYSKDKELRSVKSLCDDMPRNEAMLTNATDKNRLTYFQSVHARNTWVGVDMGTPVCVDRIRFLPRNDDNHIVAGHTYQLCYYENGKEVTHEMLTATTDSVTFKNVPTGTLYILHDLTEGSEERIFTLDEDNKIHWY